jgi:hypothetical protein
MIPPRDLDQWLFTSIQGSAREENLLSLVADFSLWVPPPIVRLVGGAVYPKTRRVREGEKRNTLLPDGTRLWQNQAARHAFWTALEEPTDFDMPHNVRKAWVCHIYGDQDSARNPEHYTHLANLVALPGALQSLSDSESVRAILKRRSYDAYGYTGPLGTIPPVPEAYPSRWPGLNEAYPLEAAQRVAQVLIDLRLRFPTFHEPSRKAPPQEMAE